MNQYTLADMTPGLTESFTVTVTEEMMAAFEAITGDCSPIHVDADYAKGRTVLLSTHIVSDVEAIADEILLMKAGRIAQRGTVAQLADTARGKVWTLHTDAATAARLEGVYTVANLRHEGEDVELRLITAAPPAGAMAAAPTLEDVYLWHFAGEEGSR